ncbi:MAG TPA: protein-L-isoaspartate(D-aspartate) O-methyltransferase [Candidatus Omnitrophica bacterium]|nr:protein-L-isoaspartate(D-aspartate) O-methyltransferase [Candidatus Omnitrophota bacterium]
MNSGLIRMVESQIESRGIKDRNVLKAMKKIDRAFFVSEPNKKDAYCDFPLAIPEGQTISQPYIVALMTELLNLSNKDRVLEIGTGSGYQTAILAELAYEVYTVERFAALTNKARSVLDRLGYGNVFYKIGDGTAGWPEHALYDKVIITAASPDMPEPLAAQMKVGGRAVAPIGSKLSQDLTLILKELDGIKKESVCGCFFVPLIGEYGF